MTRTCVAAAIVSNESRYERLKRTLNYFRETMWRTYLGGKLPHHIERLYRVLEWRAWCAEHLTTPIRLREEEANQFADFVLEETATRRGSEVGGMAGERISRQGKITHLRGSDLVERAGVAVEALQRTGLSITKACTIVAQHPLLRERLGKSRRGRPSKVLIRAKVLPDEMGWSQRKAERFVKKLERNATIRTKGISDPSDILRSNYYTWRRKPRWQDVFAFWWSNWQFYKEHVESEKLGRKNRAVLRWY